MPLPADDLLRIWVHFRVGNSYHLKIPQLSTLPQVHSISGYLEQELYLKPVIA